MSSDVVKWCCSCLTCTAYQGFGHKKPSPLKTLSVGFPYECEGVDTYLRHICQQLYGVIIIWFFAEYFTKWAEAYAIEDQTSEVMARLLVVCMSVKLLSDQGLNLLSTLLMEVRKLLDMKKIDSTSYHLKTDDLVNT